MKRLISNVLLCIMVVSLFPVIVIAAGVPSKPSINSFTAVSTSSIKIGWKAVSGAQKYRIDRRKSTEENYKTIASGCTSTSYTDKGLTAGSLYYYRVYAINSSGTSQRSETYATHTKPTTPNEPTVTRDGQSQLTISWSKVSGATHYKLLCRKGGESNYAVIANNLTATSYSHRNLQPGTQYCYRVVAFVKASLGEEGSRKTVTVESGQSNTKSKYTTAKRPSNTVDNDNPTHTLLEWSRAVGDESNYTYEIWRNGTKIGSTTSTKYIDKTGVSGTIYEYEIKINGSSWTTEKFYAGPKMTSKTVVTPESATSMKISWSKPIGGSNLTYRIKKQVGNEYVDVDNTSSTYYIDKGLNTGGFYKYYIQVRDKDGNYITSNINGSATLQILPDSVAITKSLVTLNEGDTLSLTAVISPSNSTDKAVSWSSTNIQTAAVASNGTVTAKAAGNATITVKTSNRKTASCVITVQPKICVHIYGGWINEKEANCTEEGSRYRICTKCGEGKETEVIPVTDHEYSEEWTIIKEPKCTVDGEQARICTVCGKTTDNSTIYALGHSFTGEWITEKVATCVESGIEYELCSSCGERQIREIDHLGHDYKLISDISPTETQAGTRIYKCTRCNDSYFETYVDAIEGGLISAGIENASAGSEVIIPVTINENPGISGFKLVLNYDISVLTPKAVIKGGILESGLFQSNLNEGRPGADLDCVQVTWSDVRNIYEDGELFDIIFDVNENAAYESSVVWVNKENSSLTDSSSRYIVPEFTDGAVNVSDVLKGDIYIDGNVDTNDSGLLAKHLAHFKSISLTDRQMEAADIFEDGIVNTKDGVSLAQIISGWSAAEMNLHSNNTVTIKAGNVVAFAGDYIDIPISIEDNSGIAGFELKVSYDKEYITPVYISDGSVIENEKKLISNKGVISNLHEEDISPNELDYITAYWSNAGDIVENGELFKIKFLVKKNVKVNDIIPIEISYDDGDLCNSGLNDISAAVISGEVKILDSEDDLKETEEPKNYYNINDVIIRSRDGDILNEIPIKGDFYLTVSVESKTDEYMPAKVIAAAYDANGSIILLSTDDIYISGTSVLNIGKTDKDISNIKVFIWDSINGMRPLGESYKTCSNLKGEI